MEFGITSRHLKRVTIVGGVMGAGLFAMFLIVGLIYGTLQSRGGVLAAAGWGFGIGAIMPAGVLLCSILRLRVEGDQMVQTLFGILELDRRNIADLAAVSLRGRMFPVVLSFRGGGTMRLFGIHLGQISTLANYLRERAPGCVVEN